MEVWKNEKCCGNTSHRRVFPHLFRVLPNFQECSYNLIETRRTRFLFLLENNLTKKGKQLVNFGYQNVNSLCFFLRVLYFPDRPRPSWNHPSMHNQFHAHNTQMFRAHLQAHTRLLALFFTKKIPTHERIVVQNICMRSNSRLGEICS